MSLLEKFERLLLYANIIEPQYFILSVVFFLLLTGWKFALVFFVLVIIHENGHAWEAMRQRMGFHGITVYPFGGLAHISGLPTRMSMLSICLMGPIWGLAPSVVLLAAYYLTQNADFAAGAAAMATLNLLNLLPIAILDGGKVAKALTGKPKQTFIAGTILAGILLLFDPGLILFVFLITYFGYNVELKSELENRMYTDPVLEMDIAKGFLAYLAVIGCFLVVLALAGGLTDPFYWQDVLVH